MKCDRALESSCVLDDFHEGDCKDRDERRLDWLDANHLEMTAIYGRLLRGQYKTLREAIDAEMTG